MVYQLSDPFETASGNSGQSAMEFYFVTVPLDGSSLLTQAGAVCLGAHRAKNFDNLWYMLLKIRCYIKEAICYGICRRMAVLKIAASVRCGQYRLYVTFPYPMLGSSVDKQIVTRRP